MALQGFGGPPEYLRIAPTDYYCAALACQAMLAALFVRERTGAGQRVETSLLNAVLALQSGLVVDFPGRQTVLRETPTYRLYRAGDGGWFFLACGNQWFWAKLCKAIGRPELADDPALLLLALAARPRRGAHAAARGGVRLAARDEWLRILAEHDIPAARTQTLHDFMHDPAVLHHGMVVTYEHPEKGALTLMGQPLRFSETPAADAGRPPTLGEHTEAVLRELGYADADIADLRRRRVVAGAPATA